MEGRFEQDIRELLISDFSDRCISSMIDRFDQSNIDLSPSFISQNFSSLQKLEQWAWQYLSQHFHHHSSELLISQLLLSLASFNRNLLLFYDSIEIDVKANLLIPIETSWIDRIFERMQSIDDDNHQWIYCMRRWFDNLALFLRDNSEYHTSNMIRYIHQQFARHFLMTEQYRIYLDELRQTSIFTQKQLFYLKTSSFYLSSYLFASTEHFLYTPEEVFHHLSHSYVAIFLLHTYTLASWNEELLGCITHVMIFISSCCWWGGQNGSQVKILFPTESLACQYIDGLIRIITHQPFYPLNLSQRADDAAILLDGSLFQLRYMAQNQDFMWFLRSKTSFADVLLKIARSSICNKVPLCIYSILSEILSDERLKELKIPHHASELFFEILDQAWHHPSKKYKQIPIMYFLRGFVNLSKADVIQQTTAETKKLPLLIAISDEYPIVFEILWALSFNTEIQEQLRQNSSFMAQLAHPPKGVKDEHVRKAIHGILWNLEFNRAERMIAEPTDDESMFDVMISYSHKDQVICKQLYDQLIKLGYRVWIDFEQMHGNVMDAMAYAIDRSKAVVICMSEQYRRSNYCRAEAHYAFQRQRKLIPVLLQAHYQPDGWLLFLVGQLLYIDFTAHEFSRAMAMLFEELKVALRLTSNLPEIPSIKTTIHRTAQNEPESIPLLPVSTTLSNSILEWSSTYVQQWLISHHLVQMSHILKNCDGRALIYLNQSIKTLDFQQTIVSLQDDALRRSNQNLSLVELSQFRSLMDQKSSHNINGNKRRKDVMKSNTIDCCRLL